jgi:hypothetical protein
VVGVYLLELFELKDVPLNLSMKKSKNRFFRKIMQKFHNFFCSINLSVNKVYIAKNICCIALLYRKIGRKNTFDFGGLYVGAKEVLWENKLCSDISLRQQIFLS